MKHLVRATKVYKKLNIKDLKLGIVPEVNHEWEVSDKRLKELLGDNVMKIAFVEDLGEVKKPIKKKKEVNKSVNKRA